MVGVFLNLLFSAELILLLAACLGNETFFNDCVVNILDNTYIYIYQLVHIFNTFVDFRFPVSVKCDKGMGICC